MVITTFFYYKSITTLVQILILYSRTKSSDIQAVCVYAYQESVALIKKRLYSQTVHTTLCPVLYPVLSFK